MALFGDFVTGQSVSFQRERQLLLDSGGGLQEGAVGSNDFKVAQRGAGANMSVDLAPGSAWVQIDTGTRNGLGHVVSDTTANVAVAASNATNPRVDQIILRWNDTSIPTGSGNTPTLEVLSGAATAGAQITNAAGANYRAGAGALPNDCLRLADILVAAASSSVTTASIVDRRPWARGAYASQTRTAADYTTTSTTVTAIDSFVLRRRLECTGKPVRATLAAMTNTSVVASIGFQLQVDGTAQQTVFQRHDTANATSFMHAHATVAPAAGSHVFEWQWFITVAGTANMLGNPTNTLFFELEEIARQVADNT